MRYLMIAHMMALSILCQGQGEVLRVGGQTKVEKFITCTDVFGWEITEMDAGTTIRIGSDDTVLIVSRPFSEGDIFVTAACGYDKKTGYYRAYNIPTVRTELPIFINKGTEVYFLCHPDKYVEIRRLNN